MPAAMAMIERGPAITGILPLYNQARRSVWDAVNPHRGNTPH